MRGARGCKGLLGGGWLVWLGVGYSTTLALLQPRLLAHLFGNRAVVSLLGFAHGKLSFTQFALLV